MTNSDTAQLRTCVGCRERTSRSSLVRLVADRSAPLPTVIVDPHASAPGRGAWLHPQSPCLDRAVTRRAIPRALRQPADADCRRVTEWFNQNINPHRWSSNKRAGQKPMGTR